MMMKENIILKLRKSIRYSETTTHRVLIVYMLVVFVSRGFVQL